MNTMHDMIISSLIKIVNIITQTPLLINQEMQRNMIWKERSWTIIKEWCLTLFTFQRIGKMDPLFSFFLFCLSSFTSFLSLSFCLLFFHSIFPLFFFRLIYNFIFLFLINSFLQPLCCTHSFFFFQPQSFFFFHLFSHLFYFFRTPFFFFSKVTISHSLESNFGIKKQAKLTLMIFS